MPEGIDIASSSLDVSCDVLRERVALLDPAGALDPATVLKGQNRT